MVQQALEKVEPRGEVGSLGRFVQSCIMKETKGVKVLEEKGCLPHSRL